MTSLLAFIGIGPVQLLVVAVVALLLFGKRIPEAMRGMGSGLREFKAGLRDADGELEDASSSAETHAAS